MRCSHPILVLNEQHPEYDAVKNEYGVDSLRALENAPKLQALKYRPPSPCLVVHLLTSLVRQLLNECGIGIPAVEKAELEAAEPIGTLFNYGFVLYERRCLTNRVQ